MSAWYYKKATPFPFSSLFSQNLFVIGEKNKAEAEESSASKLFQYGPLTVLPAVQPVPTSRHIILLPGPLGY